jgi:hypothetical protein
MYNTCYIPSISYSGAVGTFSETQCEHIQGIATQRFLASMGYNGKFPKEVVYGPHKLGGSE